MAGVIRRYPGLKVLAKAAMLVAFVGLGTGISGAQPIVARTDQQQGDALPSSATKHVESMAAVTPGARPATSDVKPVRRAATTGPYYVDFRARTAATYGHAFVWYGKTSEKKVEVAGLAPAGDELPYLLGHIMFVPSETGATYGDLDEQYLTASYRVYLSEADAKKVFAYIKRQQESSPLWNAATTNCTAFIGRIATFMGLNAPFHLLKPEEYVNKLRELNGGRKTVQLESGRG
ncbi:hypothetical protein [Bradyrhizobium liaoningense]|uniref:hypothetical protein n=1 Tax=Bradyrhizobium liaoningense TaxID=43992 RepID=UPI001BAB6497|nr:hypothetical protein [Bradyrhizobium liaoningense]MBR0819873.1 hypothetical protein [Bradyrhizobium liaoningense]